MTAVDRPDNGQDEGPWRVGSHYGIHVYEGTRPLGTFLRPEDAARAVTAVNGRAGAGEQQREQVEALIRRYNTGKPSWSVAEFADELLAVLGGPQPDGEAVDAVEAARACWCAHCEGIVLAADHPTNPVARIGGRRFIVCRDCGDKRCPRAAHHDRPCAYREPCPSRSHGADGWHCAVTGDHDQHTNAAGDVTW